MTLARFAPWIVPAVALLFAVSVVPSSTADAAEPPHLAHSVFFTLKDRSEKSRERFVKSCEKYLTGHEGVLTFSVGTIAEDVVEPGLSDREFDVSLLIVFRDKKTSDTYQKSPRHVEFVNENKAQFAKVRVFDTYVTPSKR